MSRNETLDQIYDIIVKSEKGYATFKELLEKSGRSRNTVSSAKKKLIDQGRIQGFKPVQGDKREIHYKITDKSYQLRYQAIKHLEEKQYDELSTKHIKKVFDLFIVGLINLEEDRIEDLLEKKLTDLEFFVIKKYLQQYYHKTIDEMGLSILYTKPDDLEVDILTGKGILEIYEASIIYYLTLIANFIFTLNNHYARKKSVSLQPHQIIIRLNPSEEPMKLSIDDLLKDCLIIQELIPENHTITDILNVSKEADDLKKQISNLIMNSKLDPVINELFLIMSLSRIRESFIAGMSIAEHVEKQNK